MIILHGLFGSSDNWHTLARRWAEFFTVYAMDQRNHGSSPHESIMNYEEMVHDLESFMLAERIGTANILGHSMGGKVAMQFASIHPDSVRGLIILDIGLDRVEGRHAAILKVLEQVDLPRYTSRRDLESELQQYISSTPIRQFLLKNILRRVDGTFSWKFNRDALLDHYDDLTASLDLSDIFMAPVLFLRGENSNYLGETLSPDILQYFPLAQLETVPDAGHWLHADQPELLFRRTTDFFNAL